MERRLFQSIFFLTVMCAIRIHARLMNFPVTENDVRVALSRCQSDYGNRNQTLINIWKQQEFPDVPQTHCYVKCFLSKLGLIDLRTMGLSFKKLFVIWANMDLDISNMCVPNFRLDADLDGKCVSYYRQWIELREKCGDLMKYVFFESDVKRPAKYRVILQSKPRGISAKEYCASVPKMVLESEPSASREPGSIGDPFNCRLSCIFRNFHYFDAEGRFDVVEILRSFDEAHHLTTRNRQAVNNCTHNANILYDGKANCRMVFELESCLRKFTEDFEKVYMYRDALSRHY